MGEPATTRPNADSSIASALRTLRTERLGLATLEAAMTGELGEAFAKAVERIRAASGRVIVSGMGKSGHMARKIAATLASTGTPAHFVHPSEASHGDLGMITSDDVVIALSWSGETRELSDILDFTARFRVTLIAMTSRADSTLARAADIALLLPKVEEACPHGLAPTTSTVLQLALGDALAVALLESRGFSAADFGVYHPGGKLGANLKRVRDVMHAGEAMPLVATGATMADAIMAMSTKSFGCTGVMDLRGHLVGIVTDGDLRRHMAPDLAARRIETVMSRAPKTIHADALVGEALEIMEAAKITALFVVEDNRPIGIVHMHDLLRIGLV